MSCCQNKHQRPVNKGQLANSIKGSHDEEVCHGTGERRRELLDQIKGFLKEYDDRPCDVTPPPVSGPNSTKRLGTYEEYIRKHCQSWMPPNPRPPLITSVQTHEVRPTGDFDRMRVNNNEYTTYTDGRFKPPVPSCDCAKRNGLQDQCERPECKPPTAQCLATNPGPCCPPSMGLTGRANQSPGGHTSHGRAEVVGSDQTQQFKETTNQRPEKLIETCYTPNQPHQYMSNVPQRPGVVCFCKVEPDELPTGQKYICCPSPAFQ